jgi:hypothetical protein
MIFIFLDKEYAKGCWHFKQLFLRVLSPSEDVSNTILF